MTPIQLIAIVGIGAFAWLGLSDKKRADSTPDPLPDDPPAKKAKVAKKKKKAAKKAAEDQDSAPDDALPDGDPLAGVVEPGTIAPVDDPGSSET